MRKGQKQKEAGIGPFKNMRTTILSPKVVVIANFIYLLKDPLFLLRCVHCFGVNEKF